MAWHDHDVEGLIRENAALRERITALGSTLRKIIDRYKTWRYGVKSMQEYNALNKDRRLGPMCPPPIELREKLDRAIEEADQRLGLGPCD